MALSSSRWRSSRDSANRFCSSSKEASRREAPRICGCPSSNNVVAMSSASRRSGSASLSFPCPRGTTGKRVRAQHHLAMTGAVQTHEHVARVPCQHFRFPYPSEIARRAGELAHDGGRVLMVVRIECARHLERLAKDRFSAFRIPLELLHQPRMMQQAFHFFG